MTAYLATHTVTVLASGPATADAYGDEADSATVVATHVPVSIRERNRRTQRLDSGTPRVPRDLIGRAPAGTTIAQGSRLQDEATGSTLVWVVDAVTQQPGPVMTPDLVLELRRIDGT